MNEQQLQQILNLQQAIAAAATAAVINSLLNPQQAASGLAANANALTDPSNNTNLQQQQADSRQSPANSSPVATNNPESNARIQELLMQLQQQAGLNSPNQATSALSSLNLTTQAAGLGGGGVGGNGLGNLMSPTISSPVSRLLGVQDQQLNATSSNTQQPTNQQTSPNKKLKRHHQPSQQIFHSNRSSEATGKPQSQHSTPKSSHNSTISNFNNRNNGPSGNGGNSSSSPFLTNNVGLPRKLVRGQDVWLGRGAEQTRQILKCMWCGQSFRTLADMTQHMKVTQHYTNIISQEQITSWRQPESSESTGNSNKHSRQSAQLRNLEDNHDDLSDKFNESDREDSFSNDDEMSQSVRSINRSSSGQNRLSKSTNELTNDNNSTTESNHGDLSPHHMKISPSSKPLTRSKKRDSNSTPTTPKQSARDSGRDKSPVNSVSSQKRPSSGSGIVLGDLNEDSQINKEIKPKNEDESPQESRAGSSEREIPPQSRDGSKSPLDETDQKQSDSPKANNSDEESAGKSSKFLNDEEDDLDDQLETDTRATDDKITRSSSGGSGDEDDENFDDNVKQQDNSRPAKKRRKNCEERSEILAINDGSKLDASGQKGSVETGDPLSALETMVEKSFDPRQRPGVANGGILQRLGIDEEVCPPWQHLNYANWYAAAAYGHPMAAALLAAGINLQNGIKLTKNVGSKKSDD